MANWKLVLVVLTAIIVFAVITILFTGYYNFLDISSHKLNEMLSVIYSLIS